MLLRKASCARVSVCHWLPYSTALNSLRVEHAQCIMTVLAPLPPPPRNRVTTFCLPTHLCTPPPFAYPCSPQSGISPSDLSDPLDQLHMLNLLATSQTRPNNMWWQAFLSTCQVRMLAKGLSMYVFGTYQTQTLYTPAATS